MGRNAHFQHGATEARWGSYQDEAHQNLSYNKIGSLEMENYGHTFSHAGDPAGPNRQVFAERDAKGLDRLSGQPLGGLS